ncbi:DCHS decarboxylase, partial [Polypterus senegalus]
MSSFLQGKELVDYIATYLSTIRERRVTPNVQPGFMRALLPNCAPTEPESWEDIFTDVEKIIMPGIVHWQSPHMHAYFPALTSWPSLLGDMLADAMNCLGFTWASSPACTELEMNVMDWLAKMLGLPDHFLHHHPDSKGGGVLQSTVSESTLIAFLSARKAKILDLKKSEPDVEESVLNARLIAYASDQAHSSVEKAGLISLLKVRFLPTDGRFSLRGETLKAAINEDRSRGLVPVLVCATLGTTGVCSFDCLSELGPLCECLIKILSFLVLLSSECLTEQIKKSWCQPFITELWVKDKYKLQQTFSVNPLYLRHENSGAATDFMHWQIPLSRRFRSLKLWFVIRSFGVKNLQAHVRHGTEMAKLFESLVRSDTDFEVPAERHLGLVVFCLKGPNSLTEALLKELTKSGAMYLIPASIKGKLIIRFTVTSQFTTKEDIQRDWNIIRQMATTVLRRDVVTVPPRFNELNAVPQPMDDTNSRINSFAPLGSDSRAKMYRTIVRYSLNEAEGKRYTSSLKKMEGSDPFDDVQTANQLRPPLLIYSHLAGQGKRKTIRSLSCNSEPISGSKDLTHLNLLAKEGIVKNWPCNKGSLLTKLPENAILLEKSALKKLTKFYSVPSFPQCSVNRNVKKPCCLLQSFKALNKAWFTCNRVQSALTCLANQS